MLSNSFPTHNDHIINMCEFSYVPLSFSRGNLEKWHVPYSHLLLWNRKPFVDPTGRCFKIPSPAFIRGLWKMLIISDVLFSYVLIKILLHIIYMQSSLESSPNIFTKKLNLDRKSRYISMSLHKKFDWQFIINWLFQL